MQLFELKLREAGWLGETDLTDECIAQGFHVALSISEDEFREWLLPEPDLDLDAEDNPLAASSGSKIGDDSVTNFVFRNGHLPRKEAGLGRSPTKTKSAINLAHNRLQTKLHEQLSTTFGEINVGTELASGVGQTSIDVVHRVGGELTFYELKIGSSIRQCIREALPQLLEYAYWPDADRATELVIVATSTPTEAARKYLAQFRERFKIPVYYQQIDAKSGLLLERI
jgi:hypothetical protein